MGNSQEIVAIWLHYVFSSKKNIEELYMKKYFCGLVTILLSISSYAGSYYTWGKTDGRPVCEKRASNQSWIRDVDRNICRRLIGVYYTWGKTDGRTVCEERASNQSWIRDVDSNICRNTNRLGSSYIRKLGSRAAWSYKQSVDDEGKLVAAATVHDLKTKTSITMSCNAPSDNVFIKISVTELVWRAAQALTEIDNDTISVSLSVKGKSGREYFDSRDWVLRNGNIILKVNPVDLGLIESFEDGSSVDVEIFALGTKEFDNRPFKLSKSIQSLKGSRVALQKIQNLCRGYEGI